MHVGVLTHNYPRFKGDYSGSFVAFLNQELTQQGARVSVLAPWDPAYAPARAQADAGSPIRRYLWRYAPVAAWHRLGYMRTMEADVRMRGETYWLAPLFFAAGTTATLRWCLRHRPDVLHAHWLLPNGFFGAIASRLLGIPLVISIPGSDALIAGQNPLFRSLARFALDQAGLITANSQSLRDVAISELGADPGRFDLIIYGVDPHAMKFDAAAREEVRQELGLADDMVLLLAVGRMVHKKGFDVLIQALAHIKAAGLLEPPANRLPVHLALVGDGDLWQAWQQLGRNLGLGEHLHWLGRVPFHRMASLYSAADVLVMPSITRPADGLNVCVLDAMACARPIIGSTAAGNTLVIRPGVNGIIVPEQDPTALARAILEMVATPAERRQQMGQASRRLIEEEFGWPHLARRYLDHYARLSS